MSSEERVLAREVGHTVAEKVEAIRAAQRQGGSPRLFRLTEASQVAFEGWSQPVQLRLMDTGDGSYVLVMREPLE